MDNYLVTLAVIGAATLGMAWIPALSKKLRISYSVVYILLGFIIYSFLDGLPEPNPTKETDVTLRLTEIVVIISLMGAGLRIDESFSFKGWAVPFKLVSVTMVASILVTTILGFYWLHLPLSSALLLGAALAPTDPVLASDVQVGPPLEKKRSIVRFSLTAEGGLNDGMAFPFTWLAIVLVSAPFDAATVGAWFSEYVVVKIVIGIIVGVVFGKGLSFLVFKLPARASITMTNDGLVGISATLLVYGITEVLYGYGFIAVFVCAVTFRKSEQHHEYHLRLHDFMDQVERILVAIVLVLFGGSIANGIFSILEWRFVAFGLISVLAIRPFCAYLSIIRSPMRTNEKVAVSFFGIKGVGSLFYLAFALKEAPFENTAELWSVVSFVILCSIIIHGLSAVDTFSKIEGKGRGDYR